MFFLIDQFFDDRFPHQYELSNGQILHIDNGWSVVRSADKTLYAKGYAIDQNIEKLINWSDVDSSDDDFLGNFAVITDDHKGTIKLKHDLDRSFPLYQLDNTLGNIGIKGNSIWADRNVSITNQINITTKDILSRFSNPLSLSTEEIEHAVLERLTKYFLLLKQFDNIKLIASGGVDTLLCLALLRYTSVPFEIIANEHWDYDQFTSNFHNEIKSHWGYKQLHHWREPTVLVSGAMGDENFARNPSTVNTILNYYDLTLDQVMKPADYHWTYFNRPKNSVYFIDKSNHWNNWADLKAQLLNINANDHQHWHLGNTITFTPFKDLNFYNLTLALSKYNLINQMADASLQKSLIAKLDSKLLKFLNAQKNTSKVPTWQLYNLIS